MKTSILVIDMINDYASPQGKIFCKTAPNIINNINKIIALGRIHSWDVVFVNTELHDNTSILAKKWGMQAQKGTWGCELVEGLNKTEEDKTVTKTTFDGFYKSQLEEVLQSLGTQTVIVTGIHTHVCVLFTAMGAANRGFDVIAIEECMTTGYAENHTTRLRQYNTHIGELYKLDAFLQEGYKKFI